MQANAAEAHASTLEARLRDAGAAQPVAQLPAIPSPYGDARHTADHVHVTPTAPTYASTPPTRQVHAHQAQAHAALKPAYQQLLDALESQQRSDGRTDAGRLRGHEPQPSRCCAHTDRSNGAASPLQPGAASWMRRQPFANVHNTAPTFQQQYPAQAAAGRRASDDSHATTWQQSGSRVQHDSVQDPRQHAGAVHMHDRHRQHSYSGGLATPSLGGQQQQQHLQGGSALERMQRLHDRLKASEENVHRRLGRLLRRPDER